MKLATKKLIDIHFPHPNRDPEAKVCPNDISRITGIRMHQQTYYSCGSCLDWFGTLGNEKPMGLRKRIWSSHRVPRQPAHVMDIFRSLSRHVTVQRAFVGKKPGGTFARPDFLLGSAMLRRYKVG